MKVHKSNFPLAFAAVSHYVMGNLKKAARKIRKELLAEIRKCSDACAVREVITFVNANNDDLRLLGTDDGVHVRSTRPGKCTKVTSYVNPPITRAHAGGPGLVVLGVAHTNGRAYFFSGPAPKKRSRLHIRVSKKSRAPLTTNNHFFLEPN